MNRNYKNGIEGIEVYLRGKYLKNLSVVYLLLQISLEVRLLLINESSLQDASNSAPLLLLIRK